MSETDKKKYVRHANVFDGLTDKQISAAKMLQSGEYTKQEIAKAVGVHYNTITHWCKNPEFMAAVKKCEQEKIRQTLALLSEGSVAATRVLMELVKCGDKRVQMEAAKYILDRNLGKTTSKIIVTDDEDDKGDFDIEAALQEIREETNDDETE